MNKAKFVYVTYIRSTPEKVWDALINPEVTRLYWERHNASDWNPGSAWEMRRFDAAKTVDIVGKVIENSPPKKLVISWASPQNLNEPNKISRVAFDIGMSGEEVKLTVTHDELEPDSDMLRGISGGWPLVLSSLKSLLETGKAIEISRHKS